jgi:hypothetical protein
MDEITGTDWTDKEVDLIVADYFDMLRLELSNQPYVKAQRNGQLQSLISRSRGSIEFKHQNISAVLMRLGEPWIRGYKPMANYQKALIEGIGRFLAARVKANSPVFEFPSAGFGEETHLFIGSPPALIATQHDDPPALKRLVQKFDPARRDERNRKLGRMGEEIVVHSERSRLIAEDRPDLARRIRWISEEDGDGAGYDILSFDRKGNERLVEVKTTGGHELTPFFISENERALSDERPNSFRLIRVFDAIRKPSAFELEPPLDNWVRLQATEYRADFGNPS